MCNLSAGIREEDILIGEHRGKRKGERKGKLEALCNMIVDRLNTIEALKATGGCLHETNLTSLTYQKPPTCGFLFLYLTIIHLFYRKISSLYLKRFPKFSKNSL